MLERNLQGTQRARLVHGRIPTTGEIERNGQGCNTATIIIMSCVDSMAIRDVAVSSNNPTSIALGRNVPGGFYPGFVINESGWYRAFIHI